MIEERVRLLLERIYFHELEHRERINARLQLPFAITIALLGGYSFLVSQAKAADFVHWAGWLYCLLGIASFFFFCYGSLLFKRAWLGHEYQVLPLGTELLAHQSELVSHYKKAGYGKNVAEREFRNVEANYFANCASGNFMVNEQRSLCLHKANNALLYSGYFLILAIILSMALTLVSKEDVMQQASATNIWMNKVNNEMTGAHRPPPPPPPPPPPTRVIREGVSSPKPTPPPPPPSRNPS